VLSAAEKFGRLRARAEVDSCRRFSLITWTAKPRKSTRRPAYCRLDQLRSKLRRRHDEIVEKRPLTNLRYLKSQDSRRIPLSDETSETIELSMLETRLVLILESKQGQTILKPSGVPRAIGIEDR
jgi:hypothetical protein